VRIPSELGATREGQQRVDSANRISMVRPPPPATEFSPPPEPGPMRDVVYSISLNGLGWRPGQGEALMNEAVFFHGARDVRVAPINLRDGGPTRPSSTSRRLGYAGATCTTTRMAGSARQSSVSRSFPVTSLAGAYVRTYLNSDLGEARSSLLIQIDLADDANDVFRVTAICARTLNSSGLLHLAARWRSRSGFRNRRSSRCRR
jgi:hypothetical protein